MQAVSNRRGCTVVICLFLSLEFLDLHLTRIMDTLPQLTGSRLFVCPMGTGIEREAFNPSARCFPKGWRLNQDTRTCR
ncbi:hypothetical protein BJX96DRAFT_153135 [Aspergillus floccosus]